MFFGATDKPSGERCPNRVSCDALEGQRAHGTGQSVGKRSFFWSGTVGIYMPLRPCAIYDLCKIRFTSRGGGIMAIYHCVVIHCALELGLLAAKLRYIYEMTKGMGKFF